MSFNNMTIQSQYGLNMSILGASVTNKEIVSQNQYTKDSHYVFESEFPRCPDYDDMPQVAAQFPHLLHANCRRVINQLQVQVSSKNRYYMMCLGSTNDDDLHKAIKYQRWTSTPSVNTQIARLYYTHLRQYQEEPLIYFLFFVNKNQRFIGLAQMVSAYCADQSFKYWWHCHFFGNIQVRWLYIADILFSQVDPTLFIQRKNKYLVNGQVLNDTLKRFFFQQYKCIFDQQHNQIDNYEEKEYESIIDYFNYLDQREDYIRTKIDKDQDFNQNFYFLEKKNIEMFETLRKNNYDSRIQAQLSNQINIQLTQELRRQKQGHGHIQRLEELIEQEGLAIQQQTQPILQYANQNPAIGKILQEGQARRKVPLKERFSKDKIRAIRKAAPTWKLEEKEEKEKEEKEKEEEEEEKAEEKEKEKEEKEKEVDVKGGELSMQEKFRMMFD